MKTSSQIYGILQWLKSGKTITALEALEIFGCMNLKGRIWDIKQCGYNPTKKMVKTESGKHIAKYSLGS
jgi:hypothetical protein